MYKYDRAIRQQAQRHRQLLISQGLLRSYDDDNAPVDVKPDLSMLNYPPGPPPAALLQYPESRPVGGATLESGMFRSLHSRDNSFQLQPSQINSRLSGADTATRLSVTTSRLERGRTQRQYQPEYRLYPPASELCSVGKVLDTRQGIATPLNDSVNMTADVSDFVLKQQSTAGGGYPHYSGSAELPPSYSAQLRPSESTPISRNHSMLPSSSYHQSILPCPMTSKSPQPDSCLRQDMFPNNFASVPDSSMVGVPDQGLNRYRSNMIQPSDSLTARFSQSSSISRAPLPLPAMIASLRRSEPNKQEMQRKLLAAFNNEVDRQKHRQLSRDMKVATQSTSVDDRLAVEIRVAMELVCKMCDQALFFLVEWARNSHIFREIKVGML